MFLTLRGLSRDTFGTLLFFRGPKGAGDTPWDTASDTLIFGDTLGDPQDTSGPEGPRDSCSWSGRSQIKKPLTCLCSSSFPCFPWKKAGKTHREKKQGFFHYAEPPKSPGKEGKSAQKSKEIPRKTKKARKSQKKEEKERKIRETKLARTLLKFV